MWSLIQRWFGKPGPVLEGAAEIAEGESRSYLFQRPDRPVLAVVVSRVDGELHAIDARCPHAGGMIVDGPLMEGRWALCPLHHYLFDARTGKQQHDWCPATQRYRVVVRDGEARLKL